MKRHPRTIGRSMPKIGIFCNMSRLMTNATKWHLRPAKTQISLGIRPVWSESSLSAWRKLGSLPTHWAYIEDSDQTGRMPRLIWVFAGRTVILLILSCRGSYFQVVYWTYSNKMSLVMRKPVFALCEQQRGRSACTSAQTDQRLCCSLPR